MKHSHNKYQKIEQVGSGSSGKIYKVLNKESKQVFAAKVMAIGPSQAELDAIET